MKSSTEEYIKWGLYALGAYLAYTKLLPFLETEYTNVSGDISNLLSSASTPSTAVVSTPTTATVNSQVVNLSQASAGYYITSQDMSNMALLAPVNTISLTFDQWTTYYNQAKGISLPLTASDANVGTTTQLNIQQYALLVNAHFPAPSLSGVIQGYYGVQQNNQWYGVL